MTVDIAEIEQSWISHASIMQIVQALEDTFSPAPQIQRTSPFLGLKENQLTNEVKSPDKAGNRLD